MPELSLRTLDQLVAEQAVAAQAEAEGRALDFRVGSVFRAVAESVGTVGLWIQALVLRVMAASRASTSAGDDLDTWMADFFVPRVGPASAHGQVTFSRFSPVASALIPAETIVRTADGVWTYQVAQDAAVPTWDPDRGGYLMPAGLGSVALPVEATSGGSGANAAPGTVTLLASAVPGVDTVTNVQAFAGGADAESDEAYRERFRLFIASLSRATNPAIDYALRNVQAGLSWSVLENVTPDGSPRDAHMTIVIDDGTGAPTLQLIERVSAAVEAVRALGVSFSITGPEVTVVNVAMTLGLKPGSDRPFEVGRVQDALEAYIEDLPLGASLSYSRLLLEAYKASDRVTNVANATLNGGIADIPENPRRAFRSGAISVA